MAKNRAHHNDPKGIIEKFMGGSPINAVILLITSINNFFNNEIRATIEPKSPQTSLLFMGIHAAALTIAEVFFKDRAERGYKRFLEEFIDGDVEDKRFSLIAGEIHAWRNILVHGWLSLRGHNIEYDYEMKDGFKRIGNDLYINPKIYLKLYLNAFSKDGRLWQYINKMCEADLLRSQQIIKQKYIR